MSVANFKIKAPIWGTRSVGLATYKVRDENYITIEKTDLSGEPVYPGQFYISGAKAKTYPVEPVPKYPKITLYIIPIDDLSVVER